MHWFAYDLTKTPPFIGRVFSYRLSTASTLDYAQHITYNKGVGNRTYIYKNNFNRIYAEQRTASSRHD